MKSTNEILGIGGPSASSTAGPGASNPVVSRYADAYLTSRAITGLGWLVKGAGVILTVISLLLLLAAAVVGEEAPAIAGAVGLVSGIPLYVLGILVSAQGQILKASLDTAVHSSPYLTDAERLQVMSLPPTEAVC